jgi:murein DD-endopeptidase MepM/ murein hydrolase activator NlpD
MKRIVLLVFIILVAIGLVIYLGRNKQSNQIENSVSNPPQNIPESIASEGFSPPIDRWSERVTKKPFGIYISPANSPVQPERFSGYHTGVDFEIFSDEQDKDVEIKAVCSGKLLEKRYVSGYGGTVVQQCKFEGQDITVLYGHLRLSSIGININQQISVGDKIGILGKGFSSETDGERKHLHISIHKGLSVDYRGYVQKSEQLSNWIDIVKYID